MLACEGGGVKTKNSKRDRSAEMTITATSFKRLQKGWYVAYILVTRYADCLLWG